MPVGSHDDGDGCTGLDGHLMETGYATSGDDGCIAEARHHATAFLERARDHYPSVTDRAVELTQLVVSELVTNACKYAPGPVLVELRVTLEAVDVVVWDSDPTVPEAHITDPDRIGQHGLEIVKAVAQELEIHREPVGKRITARIALPDTSTDGTTDGTTA